MTYTHTHIHTHTYFYKDNTALSKYVEHVAQVNDALSTARFLQRRIKC